MTIPTGLRVYKNAIIYAAFRRKKNIFGPIGNFSKVGKGRKKGFGIEKEREREREEI